MRLRFLLVLLAMSTANLAAHADTFRLDFSGSGEAGSVLLTASTTATVGTFLISSASGSIDGASVSMLPPNTYPSVGPNDNLLFFPLTAGLASFDTNGVSFLLANGTDYNLYQQAGQYFATQGPQRSVTNIDTVAVTRASAVTPEPGTLLLLGTGLLTLSGAVRRRMAGTASL